MNRKVKLQPLVTLTGTPSTVEQESRFAARVADAKVAIASINVYRHPGSTVNLEFFTTSREEPDAPTGLWSGLGLVAITNTGLFRFGPVSDLGEWIRWRASSVSGTIDFSILLELYDR